MRIIHIFVEQTAMQSLGLETKRAGLQKTY